MRVMKNEIDRLLDLLRGRLDEVTDRIVVCFRNEILPYATVPESDLRPGLRSNVVRALQALERGWEPTPEEIVEARALGEHRAQQGLPIDALLQAHRIGVREALAVVRTEAVALDVSAEAMLELATRAWAWADAVMLAAARGHREREVDLVGQEQQQRVHLLRGLLQGGLEDAGMQVGATAYGISLQQIYAPVCADGSSTALRRLERRLIDAGAHLGASLLVGHLDANLVAIIGAASDGGPPRSVVERAVSGDTDVTVAIGQAAVPADLRTTYRLTQRTLDAARTLECTGVVALPDVVLHTAVLAEPEIGKLLERRYLAPLDAEGEFGAEILASLRAWYGHGMRTEETAAALVVHPNTLRHRLKRAEEFTGASLDSTTVRFELWWALTWRQSQ